ncbi:MAG: NAD(P)H-hydrate dehydratase [Candidatus Marinimicrobia bacterium]|nr:NAD(P)H-hydrate dehydratase [Candidatus Neomarinimicrobiota bacterium]
MRVLTRQQSKMMDSLAMDREGISGTFLMGNAGKAIAEEVKSLYINQLSQDPVLIICGKGNNGGDGFATAQYLHEWNIPFVIYSIPDSENIIGDSKHFHDKCAFDGTSITYGTDLPLKTKWALVVDAILGTGFQGDLHEPYRCWTEWMNNLDCPIVAADIPSGVDSNNGQLSQDAIYALRTVTMGNSKLGLQIEPGKSHGGTVTIADIGFPDVYKDLTGLNFTIFDESLSNIHLQKPSPDAYKYSMGRVLIIAGSTGMTGAAILAAKAALRSGAGLVKVCIPEMLNSVFEASVIEAISIACPDDGNGYFTSASLSTIREQIEWCDVALIGPGVGIHKQTIDCLKQVISESKKPLIIDADGLRVFESQSDFTALKIPYIITPHYGEWSRIISKDVHDIKQDLNKHLESFLEDFTGVLHLKNAPSMTAFQQNVIINSTGNSGLASGGTGDVLAGIIAGLVGQRISVDEAAQMGAYIHGKAADELTKSKGYRGLIASDLIEMIPSIIAPYER